VTGDWRKLHKEESRHFCFSLDVIKLIKLRRIGWAGNVACIASLEILNFYSENLKRRLGGPRCRCEVNIKVEFKRMGCEGVH
jgi:hypothetical protein